MSKLIEVFTDSSRFSNDVESQVRNYACSRCSIIVYDVSNPTMENTIKAKASEYGVTALPAVTIDGKLIPLDKLNRSKISNLIRRLSLH